MTDFICKPTVYLQTSNPKPPQVIEFGSPGRTRTADPVINSQSNILALSILYGRFLQISRLFDDHIYQLLSTYVCRIFAGILIDLLNTWRVVLDRFCN